MCDDDVGDIDRNIMQARKIDGEETRCTEVSRIESKATKAGRSLDTRCKIRRKRYPWWEARRRYRSRMHELFGWYFWGSNTHDAGHAGDDLSGSEAQTVDEGLVAGDVPAALKDLVNVPIRMSMKCGSTPKQSAKPRP